jgi:hypothetical protein
MKLIALIAGWSLVVFGAAVGALVVESLLYRRRVQREAALHNQLGVGGAYAAKRR